ncbi:Uncharacterized protein DAT39_017079 [Clarias magur]|uniref:Uncharacterized protein n=1 Tax=Clarias magur TaxID=1594786 RepID=A0A8J4U980_CLAMG|nr:Uncharacterized protein DAT39_017079 [Clarias magur]
MKIYTPVYRANTDSTFPQCWSISGFMSGFTRSLHLSTPFLSLVWMFTLERRELFLGKLFLYAAILEAQYFMFWFVRDPSWSSMSV